MIREVVTTIVDGREWSWALISCFAIFIALGLRGLVLRDLLWKIKSKDRDWYKNLQVRYQRRSAAGWVFIAMFAAGVTLFWRFENWFLRHLDAFRWMAIFVAFLAVSLICHLRAYAEAMIETICEEIGTEQDI